MILHFLSIPSFSILLLKNSIFINSTKEIQIQTFIFLIRLISIFRWACEAKHHRRHPTRILHGIRLFFVFKQPDLRRCQTLSKNQRTGAICKSRRRVKYNTSLSSRRKKKLSSDLSKTVRPKKYSKRPRKREGLVCLCPVFLGLLYFRRRDRGGICE